MSKKTKYQQMCDDISDKVKATAKDGRKPTVMTSKTDLVMMTTALLNSPEHCVTTYDKRVVEKDGAPLAVETRPAQRYRDAMKPVLRSMGIDKAEVDKLDDIQFSKEHGAAMVDVVTTAMKDYIDAGRRFQFPITSLDESQMSFAQVDVPERTTMPNRFKTDEEGHTVTVPTGQIMTTKAHKAIKAFNRNPAWLKTHKDIK